MKVYITPSLHTVQLNAEPVMDNLSMDSAFTVDHNHPPLTQEEAFSKPIWGGDDAADENYNSFDELVGF